MKTETDLIGKQFGCWTVLRKDQKRTDGSTSWLCQCSCEAKTLRSIRDRILVTGEIPNCGCQLGTQRGSGNFKHGMYGTPTHGSYKDMLRRCYDPNRLDYKNYGGRGIQVCLRWRQSFYNFFADMGKRKAGETIDRMDNDGNYSCGKCEECQQRGWVANCRWIPRADQMANRRNIAKITYQGKTLHLSEWARLLGIPFWRLYRRYHAYGWRPPKLFDVRPYDTHGRPIET